MHTQPYACSSNNTIILRLATAEGRTSVSTVVADLTREKGLAGLFFGVENKLAKSCTAKFIYFYIGQIGFLLFGTV